VSNGYPRIDDGRVLEDVRTVVWCTGFRPDFRWIQLPVFGPEGYPEHRRGIVAAAPGLGFVGLRYQYRIGSSLIGGVHQDAEYVVRQLATHNQGGRNADHGTKRHAGIARRAEPRPSRSDAGGDAVSTASAPLSSLPRFAPTRFQPRSKGTDR